MSEWGDLFTSFYNQFVLRDLLSMILPGFTILIVFLWFFCKPYFYLILSQNLSLLSLIFILSISYFIGVVLIGVSDCLHLPFKTFYTDNQNELRAITKRFDEKLCNHRYRDTDMAKQFIQIRERYITFMQACGNFAYASIISLFIIIASRDEMQSNILLDLFVILFSFSTIGYFNFKKAFKCWDSLILEDKTSQKATQKDDTLMQQ